MKKAISILLALTLVFGLAACGEKAGNDGGDRIQLEFAWCTDNVDISQQSFFDTASAYCDYLNKTRTDIYVTMTLYDGQASVDKQISDIETAVAKGVDGIILSCVDPDGIAPAAKKAIADGVPVLAWRELNDPSASTINFINGDEHIKGKFNYEWTKQYLIDNPDVVLYAGLQQGSTNHPVCYPRMDPYMYDLADEMPDQFKILVEANSDWSSDTSMQMVEDWLQVYPEMNYICSSSEEQMLGVIEALRGEDKLDDFVLTTFNGEQTGIDMLKKGEIMLDIGVVMPMGMGLLVEAAINMVLDGKTGEVDISEQAMFSVTQDNYEEYESKIVVDFDTIEYFPTTLKDSYR